MSCEYCTPILDEDGNKLEFCKTFHHVEHKPKGDTTTRMTLVWDEDGWDLVILMHDDWLSEYIHSLGERAHHAGFITTCMSVTRCPFCGREL